MYAYMDKINIRRNTWQRMRMYPTFRLIQTNYFNKPLNTQETVDCGQTETYTIKLTVPEPTLDETETATEKWNHYEPPVNNVIQTELILADARRMH
jgi:hypothetical protein